MPFHTAYLCWNLVLTPHQTVLAAKVKIVKDSFTVQRVQSEIILGFKKVITLD